MEYIQGTGRYQVEGDAAVTLGKFDGLHRGHQKLVGRIKRLERQDCKSVIFTLNRMEKEQILTDAERRRMAEKLQVDYLIDCPLTETVSRMEAEEFIEEILVRQLHAKYVVVGTDFRFGYQRRGDYKLLMELQKKYGYTVDVVPKEQYQGRDISSTYVREELAAGNVEIVNELLGYSFFVSGEVVHGWGNGNIRRLPAIHVAASERKLLLPNGVYTTRTIIGKVSFPGVTSIDFHSEGKKRLRRIETYLFDFERDLRGENIEIQFLKRADSPRCF